MRKFDEKSRLLSAAGQARQSWAKQIFDFEQVPEVFKEAFQAQFKGENFPYTLLTPSFTGFLQPEQEQLVTCTDRALLIFEARAGLADLTIFNFEAIHRVEAGAVLLFSWLSVMGIDQGGMFRVKNFKYSSVGEALFKPVLGRIRACQSESAGAGLDAELVRFDFLSSLNIKFMNYGRQSLCTGSRLLGVIYQPEQRKVLRRILFWPVSRLAFATHLLILTDNELINIQDASKVHSYGGIWDYVSLAKIRAVRLEAIPTGLSLILEFPGNDRLAIPFELSKKVELESICEAIISKLPK